MRKFIWMMVAGILVLLMVWLAGKGQSGAWESTKQEKNMLAMDTYMSLCAYGAKAEVALEEAGKRILDIEKVFSVTDEESEIYKINHRETPLVVLSKECMKVFLAAREISQNTDGAFDLTMYPVLKGWGFTTGSYQVPDQETLEALLQKTGYQKILVQTETNAITLEDGMEIDFGGIAKGYASDEAVRVLKENGITSAILSLGGNIQTVGSKPDGSAWTVAVKNPDQSEHYFGILKVKNKAVVTSGAYERYFEENGKKYGHILNPKTGEPADNEILSVTIVGDSAMTCDALSTAMFVKGLEEAEQYWKAYGGFEAIFLTKEKEIYVTEGLKNNFEAAGDYKMSEIHWIKK